MIIFSWESTNILKTKTTLLRGGGGGVTMTGSEFDLSIDNWNPVHVSSFALSDLTDIFRWNQTTGSDNWWPAWCRWNYETLSDELVKSITRALDQTVVKIVWELFGSLVSTAHVLVMPGDIDASCLKILTGKKCTTPFHCSPGCYFAFFCFILICAQYS